MAKPDRLARALVDAALELHRQRLWLEVPADTPIHVRVPDEPHPVVVIVMGHMGSDYGLFMVRGEHAPEQFRRYIATAAQTVNELDLVSVTMDPLGTIPPHLRRVIDAAGIQARREAIVPAFFAKQPHADAARALSRAEQRLVLAVIRGLLLARNAGELRVMDLGEPSARLLEITVEGEGRELRAKTRSTPWKAPPLVPDVPELDVPPGLPVLDERWIAGTIGARGSSPSLFEDSRVILIVDERSGLVIDQCVADLDQETEALGLFSEAIRGDSDERRLGFPREVIFTDEQLFGEVAASLEEHGVRCSLAETHAVLDPIVAALRSGLPEALIKDRDRFDKDALPTTLQGWKAADLRVTRRLSALLDAGSKSIDRVLGRFFGAKAIGVEVFQKLQHLQPIASFIEWRMTDYRATARSRTFLERRLEKKRLPRVERALIEARIQARISIYRIVATQPGASLDVEDLFDGQRFTVHDRAMSGCALEGYCVPLRVMKIGSWHFVALAGPPLPPLMVSRAIAWLDSLGVELSADGLRRSPHVLGWLWELALPHHQEAPKICNTDGDPLLWHSASFRLADASAVARALDTRKDLRFDEVGGDWSWWRPGGPAPGFGDNTILGRIQIIDTRLVLEVNSAERFARARKWIETLPGVEFERVTTQKLVDPERPLDDRLESKRVEASPEMIEMLREAQRKACMSWLDQRIPMLGNRTPRQVCKTTAGRRKVEAMIRSMPAAGSPHGPLEPPRAELLEEIAREATK